MARSFESAPFPTEDEPSSEEILIDQLQEIYGVRVLTSIDLRLAEGHPERYTATFIPAERVTEIEVQDKPDLSAQWFYKDGKITSYSMHPRSLAAPFFWEANSDYRISASATTELEAIKLACQGWTAYLATPTEILH